MATVDFKYNYPYTGFGETARFQTQWSENRTKINGSYTYPMVFNESVPKCSHIKILIEIGNTGSVNIFGRVWEFMVNRKNYGWCEILSFTINYTLLRRNRDERKLSADLQGGITYGKT